MKPQKQPKLPAFVEKAIVGKVWKKVPPERQVLSCGSLMCSALTQAFSQVEVELSKAPKDGSRIQVDYVVVSRERFADMVAWNLMEDGVIFGAKVFADRRIPVSTALVCSRWKDGMFAKVEVGDLNFVRQV
jgi:hypothetical protein